MAIDIGKLGIFGQIKSRQGSAGRRVLNLTSRGTLTSGGIYRSWNLFGRWGRSSESKARNNETRTELLRSLGKALDVQGMEENARGEVTFRDDFLANLRAALGDRADVLGSGGDFQIVNGKVVGGRPLTERRVVRIADAVRAKSVEQNLVPQPEDDMKPVADMPRKSVRQLAEEQRDALRLKIGSLCTEARLPVLKQAVLAVTGLGPLQYGKDDVAKTQAIDAAFADLVRAARSGDVRLFDDVARRFDEALLEFPGMTKRESTREILLDQLPDQVRGIEIRETHKAFCKMSAHEQFVWAKKHPEELDRIVESNPHDRPACWMKGLLDTHGYSRVEASLKQLSQPQRNLMLSILMRHTDAGANLISLIAAILSRRADTLETLFPDDKVAPALTNELLWDLLFEEQAPRDLPQDAKRFTQRLADSAEERLESLLANELEGIRDDSFRHGRMTQALAYFENMLTTTSMPMSACLKIAAGQLKLLTAQDLKGYQMYDLNEMKVAKNLDNAFAQFSVDFLRLSSRTYFGDNEIDIAPETYKKDPHSAVARYRAAFEAFTGRCSERQRLVLAYLCSQAGMALAGAMLNGNVSKGTVLNFKWEGDEVQFTLTVPKNAARSIPGLSYTFSIDANGRSEPVDFRLDPLEG